MAGYARAVEDHRAAIKTPLRAWGRLGELAGMGQRPVTEPAPTAVRALQRQVGNGALQRILHSAPAASLLRCGTHPCDCPAEIWSRAEFSMSHPWDPAEREADEIADQVMRTPVGDVEVTRTARARLCPCGGGCDAHDEQLLRSRLPGRGSQAEVPSGVSDVLHTPGMPLEPITQTAAKDLFGYSFANVRIHTDAHAAATADAVGARAYTVGSHIIFAPGQYAPGTASGDRLLAHELTHVVQQSGATGGTVPQTVSHPGDPAEAEAERIAADLGGNWNTRATVTTLAAGGDAAFMGQAEPLAKARGPSAAPRQGGSFSLQRQQDPTAGPAGEMLRSDPVRSARLDVLLTQIAMETETSLRLRAQIEALPPVSSVERADLEASLNTSRSSLIGLLQERMTLLTAEIASLNARIGPVRASFPEHPEADELANELIRRENELHQHEQQLRPLRRWQTREEIVSIGAELAEIEQELTVLPPVSDPSHPQAELLALRRNELEQYRNYLARTLTAGAVEYKQFDPRWGAIRYGPSAQCTNIKEAGCGPTSLAIVLNYLYQEDPETLVGSSGFEIVTPPETAAYAATHGRVCNNGTAGDTMVTQVGTAWPGFRGQPISLTQAATELRAGRLVIFLCHNCTGQTRSGGTMHYGGHFMVLSAISDDSSTYNVLDPGASEASDIETISHQELQSHTGGFWIVAPK